MPPDNELLISKKSLYIVVVPEQTLEPLLFSGEDHPERVHLKSAHTLLLPLPPLDALHYTPSIPPVRILAGTQATTPANNPLFCLRRNTGGAAAAAEKCNSMGGGGWWMVVGG